MKKYDRTKKEWVSEEEYERRKKKSEKCKGGAEHDFVEVLPFGMEAGPNYGGSVEPYHKAMSEISEFTKKKYSELEEIGIKSKSKYKHWDPPRIRTFMCSMCKKKKYE